MRVLWQAVHRWEVWVLKLSTYLDASLILLYALQSLALPVRLMMQGVLFQI